MHPLGGGGGTGSGSGSRSGLGKLCKGKESGMGELRSPMGDRSRASQQTGPKVVAVQVEGFWWKYRGWPVPIDEGQRRGSAGGSPHHRSFGVSQNPQKDVGPGSGLSPPLWWRGMRPPPLHALAGGGGALGHEKVVILRRVHAFWRSSRGPCAKGRWTLSEWFVRPPHHSKEGSGGQVLERGGAGLRPKSLCTKNSPTRFFRWGISFFPTLVTLV